MTKIKIDKNFLQAKLISSQPIDVHMVDAQTGKALEGFKVRKAKGKLEIIDREGKIVYQINDAEIKALLENSNTLDETITVSVRDVIFTGEAEGANTSDTKIDGITQNPTGASFTNTFAVVAGLGALGAGIALAANGSEDSPQNQNPQNPQNPQNQNIKIINTNLDNLNDAESSYLAASSAVLVESAQYASASSAVLVESAQYASAASAALFESTQYASASNALQSENLDYSAVLSATSVDLSQYNSASTLAASFSADFASAASTAADESNQYTSTAI